MSETSEKSDLPKNSDKPVDSRAVVSDPELDALLDDALQDFDKPLPPPKPRPAQSQASTSSNNAQGQEMNQIWSEEFIREATSQFEKKMRELVTQGSNTSDPNVPNLDNLTKIVDAASQAAVQGKDSDDGFSATVNEAIKNMTMKSDVMQNPLGFSDSDLSKLMGSFSMGDMGNLEEGEMDDVLPFMTNMMQKLLSKELLQPVLADIVLRYPEWLAENREKLPSEEYEKYNRQYEFMKRICVEYDAEKPTDSETVKQQRFDRISELMLKVQTAGPPPKELVGEEGSLPKIDAAMAEQCSIM